MQPPISAFGDCPRILKMKCYIWTGGVSMTRGSLRHALRVVWCGADANEFATVQLSNMEPCPRPTKGERTNRMAKQAGQNQTSLTTHRSGRRGLALAQAY